MKKNKIKRTFIPGTEWIYFKIYTNENTADYILLKIILPIVKKYIGKYVDKWFFIRYTDPDFHIRVRFHLTSEVNLYNICNISKLEKELNSKRVWKIQWDTYIREIERYGKNTIELAETLFCIDSFYCLKILALLQKSSNPLADRWFSSFILIDNLFDAFKVPIKRRHDILKHLSINYKLEFGFNEYNSKQFNTLFREKKQDIHLILTNQKNEIYYQKLYSYTTKRKEEIMELNNEIRQEIKKDKTLNFDNLLMSYIHMTLNRLFASKPRENELIVYNLLHRYYEGVLARKKYNHTL